MINILRKVFALLFIIGINRGIKAIKYKKKIDNIRPKSGWLGMLVATDQKSKGNVAAYEINREMLRIANETNENIYVETTVPRVRILYKRAGYNEYASIKHPYVDLTVWFMEKSNN